MDFTLSDEQRLLKDSVDRLMADRYAFDQRKNHFKEPGGWSAAQSEAALQLLAGLYNGRIDLSSLRG